MRIDPFLNLIPNSVFRYFTIVCQGKSKPIFFARWVWMSLDVSPSLESIMCFFITAWTSSDLILFLSFSLKPAGWTASEIFELSHQMMYSRVCHKTLLCHLSNSFVENDDVSHNFKLHSIWDPLKFCWPVRLVKWNFFVFFTVFIQCELCKVFENPFDLMLLVSS